MTAPCPSCAAPTVAGDRFCESCGTPLACESCGTLLAPDEGGTPPACESCGTLLVCESCGISPASGEGGTPLACESCGSPPARDEGGTSPERHADPAGRVGIVAPHSDVGQFDVGHIDRRQGATFAGVADGAQVQPAGDDGGGVWRSSRAPGGPCAGCGEVVGDDGYCDGCGLRRGAGLEHAEDELPGIAAVTDRGLRKGRNEDAYAIGVAGGRRAVVVCDGVSSAPDSDAAATTAVVEAIGVLVGGGDIVEAHRVASEAVAKLAASGAPFDAPACTFLAAVVEDGQVSVGWVGDSRAYWLDGDGARCLTVDDSLAGQLAAAGVDTAAMRLSAQAAALTRWLGADAPAGAPHVVTLRPGAAGVLLLASDGLTRYPTWIDAIGDRGAPELARHLTAFARDAGGADNITVVAVPIDAEPDRGEARP